MEQKNNAKFAFFYMLSLVGLIFTAISVGIIIFQLINKFIPDLLNDYSGGFSSSSLKFAISALIIAAPIYYFITYLIMKNLYKGNLDKESPIRKWLTYLVLFITSVIMIGWMIGVINNFLDGELTVKFILKALTAIGIAAAIFSFYLYDIRRAEVLGKQDNIIKCFFYGGLAAVLVVFVSAFFIVESPFESRNRKIDQSIINDFSRIDSAIYSYYAENEKLPENLEAVLGEINFIREEYLINPVSKKKYEYNYLGGKKYELCTDFQTSNQDFNNGYDYYRDEKWLHDVGYQCIEQKVPDLPEKRAPLPLPEGINLF